MSRSISSLLQRLKQYVFGQYNKPKLNETKTIQLPQGTEEFAQSLEQCVDKLHALLSHTQK